MAQWYLVEAESDANKVWAGIGDVQIAKSHAFLIGEKESQGRFCPLKPKHLCLQSDRLNHTVLALYKRK